MKKPKLKKLGLSAIQQVLINTNSDVEKARESLAFAIGASVDVCGIVLKVIKRNDQCKLTITPNDTRLTIFADFSEQSDSIKEAKIRKKSKVSINGKLRSFGYQFVCLSDCVLKP
jgi:RecG-like helicase